MQHAVYHQVRHMRGHAFMLRFGFGVDHRGAKDDVAHQRFIFIGKRQHVGRFVLAAVGVVQMLAFFGIHKTHGDRGCITVDGLGPFA